MSDAQDNVGLFKTENIYKAAFAMIGLLIQGVCIFYSVKQEIHDNKTFDTAEKQIINYRLQSLESHFTQAQAILPKEIKIEPK